VSGHGQQQKTKHSDAENKSKKDEKKT